MAIKNEKNRNGNDSTLLWPFSVLQLSCVGFFVEDTLNKRAGFSLQGGTQYQYQDTEESVPAYFQTEHKEIHFKCNFLPSYSPIGAPPPTSKLNETPEHVPHEKFCHSQTYGI